MLRAELEDLLTMVPQMVTIPLCQSVVSTMRLLNYPTGLWRSSERGGRVISLEMLRDEYDLAWRYTQSLYADLPEADVHWHPAPQNSNVGWHLGHQAAVTHFLVRNC